MGHPPPGMGSFLRLVAVPIGSGQSESFRPGRRLSRNMNAVEIEEAVSQLAEQPFDAVSFPFAFLEAFGNKPTTIQRLKSRAR